MSEVDKETIDDAQGLDALSDEVVIMSAPDSLGRRRPYVRSSGYWLAPGLEGKFTSGEIALPATILHRP